MAIIYDFVKYKKDKENASPYRDWLKSAREYEEIMKGVTRPEWCRFATSVVASCWTNTIQQCLFEGCTYIKRRE